MDNKDYCRKVGIWFCESIGRGSCYQGTVPHFFQQWKLRLQSLCQTTIINFHCWLFSRKELTSQKKIPFGVFNNIRLHFSVRRAGVMTLIMRNFTLHLMRSFWNAEHRAIDWISSRLCSICEFKSIVVCLVVLVFISFQYTSPIKKCARRTFLLRLIAAAGVITLLSRRDSVSHQTLERHFNSLIQITCFYAKSYFFSIDKGTLSF